ncbi:hypothetical protein ZOSMA_2G03500 [Zostera marina]|uniref:F-box domain-containing protein n=1 Tax=Zostera marina TaxID=29655 RepID=A0A0K9PB60_ZOSMR|nr:hypothetical protein ZOSMA_2G03500 [Zostera marina]
MEVTNDASAENSKVNEDRITSLSDDIKQMILDHLSLKEAVSTSFLSRDWRYVWRFCSNFFLDDRTFPNIINAVNEVLSVHKRDIHTFFAIGNDNGDEDEDEDEEDIFLDISSELINSWLDCLANARVRNLKLRFRTENISLISSSLFRCDRLITLDLAYMKLVLPQSFNEFRSLTNINFKYLFINSLDLERLIKSCPLLKKLKLNYLYCEILNIHSLNLKYLKVSGYYSCVNLNETPMITDASISTTFFHDDCDFTNVLHNLTGVKALDLKMHTIKHLKLDNGLIFNNMEKLNVTWSLDCKEDTETIISILRCSPTLDCLHIQSLVKGTFFQEIEQFWDVFVDFKLNRLKIFSIYNVWKVPPELRLIEFVFRNAPLLEQFHTNNLISGMDDEFYKDQIMSFPKDSSSIKFCFSCLHKFQ